MDPRALHQLLQQSTVTTTAIFAAKLLQPLLVAGRECQVMAWVDRAMVYCGKVAQQHGFPLLHQQAENRNLRQCDQKQLQP